MFKLQQNKIIRICLDTKTMVGGSTNQNYKLGGFTKNCDTWVGF